MAQQHPYLEPLPLTGGVTLANRILPGPMEGITTGAFCAVLSRAHWVHCWLTPFLRVSTGVPRLARLRVFLAPYLEAQRPVVAQIMGLDIGLLCATAGRLAELGVAAVDLNCACPSRTVLANGAGAARLRHPDWIAAALRALRQALPRCGLSIKLRSGLTDPAEMTEVLPAVAAARPDFVTLHFRTAAENYDPVPAGWQRLAQARDLLRGSSAGPAIPLVGCGDVLTAADALRVHAETGVDGVAAARGLMRNPRLLREIETACGGQMPPPPARQAALAALREMAALAAATRSGRPGFVLELARNMLGEDDLLFQDLARCRTLAQAVDRLAAVTVKESHEPQSRAPGTA